MRTTAELFRLCMCAAFFRSSQAVNLTLGLEHESLMQFSVPLFEGLLGIKLGLISAVII
jgi:hypothetical protein